MSTRRRIAAATAAVLLSLATVHACGPDWTPDVFVRQSRPDVPKDFFSGKLGVLQEGYYRYNLIAAYRFLSGGTLGPHEVVADDPASPESEQSPEELNAMRDAAPRPDDKPAPDRWLAARNALARTPMQYAVNNSRNLPGLGKDQYGFFENCNAPAFNTAIDTLKARADIWGAKSDALATWIANQDIVFSNCDDRVPNADSGAATQTNAAAPPHLPPPVPATASLLLRQDTAYQTAAANFYALQFETATAEFTAIGHDKASPWHALAAYLVARTTVRQAMLVPPSTDPKINVSFDLPRLEQAAQQLAELQHAEKTSGPGLPASAIQHELSFVQSQLDPEARIRAASLALAGPAPDPDFQQDLTDLVLLLNQRLDKDYPGDPTGSDSKAAAAADAAQFEQTAHLRQLSPLVDWLIVFQSEGAPAQQYAVAQWKKTHAVPWLVAAITKTQPGDPDAAALIEAAAKTDPHAPAWPGVTYHRARLLSSAHPEAARALLDTTLPVVRASGPISAANAFSGLRMRVATSLDDLLTYAPRRDQVAVYSQNAGTLAGCRNCDQKIAPQQFDRDAAGFFNRQASLEDWLKAATATQLPPGMRNALVLVGWTRAVALNNTKLTPGFAALLPGPLHAQAGDSADFHAWLTLLRNPGLRFYLDAGVQRSQSASELDSYHNNWWCGAWSASPPDTPGDTPVETVPVTFLSASESAAAKTEYQALVAAGDAPAWMGRRVIDYARANPTDKDVPEALHLVVRSTRYGCSSYEDPQKGINTSISTEAFKLLHSHYAGDPWTRKTPYHY